MSITGDEPNEFSFSKDGVLAYVGHHGAMFTESPSDQMHVAIVDAATFTVKKRIPMMASATVPGYVDIDPEAVGSMSRPNGAPRWWCSTARPSAYCGISNSAVRPRLRGGADAR